MVATSTSDSTLGWSSDASCACEVILSFSVYSVCLGLCTDLLYTKHLNKRRPLEYDRHSDRFGFQQELYFSSASVPGNMGSQPCHHDPCYSRLRQYVCRLRVEVRTALSFVYETHLKVKLSLLGARSAILCAVRLLLLLFLLAYIFLVGGTVIMAAQKFLCVRGSSVTAICWHHWK